MTFDPAAARAYVVLRIESGAVTAEDVARLTAAFQQANGLPVDGKPGPATLALLRPVATPAAAIAKLLVRKVYPLPQLADGRRPRITSAHKSRNVSRPNHDGCDLFYAYLATLDGPVKVGDGGATRDRKSGAPKWFIPAGTCAIAAAPGVVTIAGTSRTGCRVWIEHADGYRTGYFHLRDTRVVVGQVVACGTPLGEVGDNPVDRDAEHLHFEVSPVGEYRPIDPEPWLAGASYFGS